MTTPDAETFLVTGGIEVDVDAIIYHENTVGLYRRLPPSAFDIYKVRLRNFITYQHEKNYKREFIPFVNRNPKWIVQSIKIAVFI